MVDTICENMPAGSGIGYIVVGVVIGVIVGWLLNDLALYLGKRSQASQLKERNATIEDLEEENDRLLEEVRTYRREKIARKSKRRKDTL
jgi:uncharacterized membrane-anchored protein YhcB (DUF1043 family)